MRTALGTVEILRAGKSGSAASDDIPLWGYCLLAALALVGLETFFSKPPKDDAADK